jgi:hypothetical protein
MMPQGRRLTPLEPTVGVASTSLDADNRPAEGELDRLQLEQLLLTDFGASPTAAEFDAVALQVLTLLDAKDDEGRRPDDPIFLRWPDDDFPCRFKLHKPELLAAAVAAGLFGRLVALSVAADIRGFDRSPFQQWATGHKPDHGVGKSASATAADAPVAALRVTLVAALLLHKVEAGSAEPVVEARKTMLSQMSRSNLPGLHVPGANLRGVDLSYSHLEKADLSETNLEDANISEARLEGARVSEASAQRIRLNDSYLQGADFRSSNLAGADLRSAMVGTEPGPGVKTTLFKHVCAAALRS